MKIILKTSGTISILIGIGSYFDYGLIPAIALTVIIFVLGTIGSIFLYGE